MKDDFDTLDALLNEALSPKNEPDETLDQKIIRQIKEKDMDHRKVKRRIPAAALVAILVLALSTTAFAAWKLLTPTEVAEKTGNQQLAEAFNGEGALQINKTENARGYAITLLGLVSGKGLSGYSTDVDEEKTYAVVSIGHEDGSPMPDSTDEDYGQVPFFVSPLIKGLEPWKYNIATMGGGYCEFVNDGILYRLIECDSIEMFADRGLSLCVSDTAFYNTEAFNYDESTGEISPNTSYQGVNVLFDLPLDPAAANPAAAQKYIQDMNTNEAKERESNNDMEAQAERDAQIEAALQTATLLEDSVKELTAGSNGLMSYIYDGSEFALDPQYLFEEGQTGMADQKFVIEEEEGVIDRIVCFSKDDSGVIKGMTYQVSK